MGPYERKEPKEVDMWCLWLQGSKSFVPLVKASPSYALYLSLKSYFRDKSQALPNQSSFQQF